MISTTAITPGDSIRDKALRILRQGIVSGEIRTGEIYSATALARQLGVSVSPVREAMLTLVNTGIMEPVRNRGFRVLELSTSDLDEILEIRLFLEVPALQALATTDLSAKRERIEELVRATQKSAADCDINDFLAADREFHLDLLMMHGNKRLATTVANLRDQTRLYGLQNTDANTLSIAAEEHRGITDALLAGDANTVGALLTAHLGHVRKEWATL